MNFQKVLEKYRAISFSEADKGTRFERLIQAFLKTVPWYEGKFKHIWLWNEFPYKQNIGGKDTGIDLVAQTVDGDFWAIQCKCWNENAKIDKPSVDSFLATSSKTFVNDQHKTTTFAVRLWISTTNNWGSEAENAIKHQNPPVLRLNLLDLEEAPVDWEELDKGISGTQARTAKKALRPHQKQALENFHGHFQTGDRGKLIMACGTGKTFTALKIAEHETPAKGFVLFLVPSIALLGQTLREWTAESDKTIFPICICSDPEVSKRKNKDEETDGYTVEDLALPASTDVPNILKQLESVWKNPQDGMIVVFSTYQSIEVIAQAQKEFKREFDLIICDEAHRTTGVTLKDEEEAAFTKVHDNQNIQAKKRLYMTATPRLYREEAKEKAKEAEAILCSMDDEAIYGPDVYRIGFSEAVEKKLLSDYKVLVLTLNESQIPDVLQKAVADKGKEINTDDASKLIGCINALSKRMLVDEGLLKASDPNPMHKAVAFCQTIKVSKKITGIFNEHKDDYYNSLTLEERAELVGVSSDHIDGTMGATLRNEKLSWLKSASTEANECRILTNVRCLSEGVDVPSLDAVMFLSARNSQIDVVQSVGRVMRVAPGKNYGYIIIPVVIPAGVEPEEALEDHDRFKVVWTVLNALRAHDDRFNAMVNKLELNKHKPKGGGTVLVGGIGGESGDRGTGDGKPKPKQIFLPLPEIQKLQDAIYARMVQKVGNRRYWEQWAADVAKIAEGYIERINRLIAQEGPHKATFDEFLVGVQKNLNPSVTSDEVVEMLAQHMITKPVFEALFENYSFVQSNPVSQALQGMIDLLEEQALEKDTLVLSRFYESVKNSVSKIDNAEARQKIIVELYEKFFKTAFPKMEKKLGIVYTPIEIVDFINNSVAAVLEKEFGRKLSDENVHILDPFTGTGTFITRMIQSGLIDKDALPRKYAHELHANEIVLLAYYIASINIENAFHDAMGEETVYQPFNGICLTDTFQLSETEDQNQLYTPKLKQNSERVVAQVNAPIQVIIGNPPYSIGQKSANDDAQNQRYPKLEKCIADTYVRHSKATLSKGAYDSYIKAFRWASDRLDKKYGGIIAFVTNNGWLEKGAADGIRNCFAKEFSSIYVFNLRGAVRGKIGEEAKKEGGNVFDIMTGVSIAILIKKPKHNDKNIIRYIDIGDYLKKDEKLCVITKSNNVSNITLEWINIHPNEHGDWLHHRNTKFNSFICIEPDKKFNIKAISYFSTNAVGISTNRDIWVYNYSKQSLSNNVKNTINFYEMQRQKYALEKHKIGDVDNIFVNNKNKISWSRGLKNNLIQNKAIKYDADANVACMYRPFTKSNLYFSSNIIEMPGIWSKLFPSKNHKNLAICVPGIGDRKGFSAVIVNAPTSLDFFEKTQCFPLFYYEKIQVQQSTLFDSKDEYTRRDGITDFILNRCRDNYGLKVTKEDIFYYVYGLLHSPDYRTQFVADLKKMLPRLPLVDKPDDFWVFSKAGRALADLHLNYEKQPPCAEVKVTGAETGKFQVENIKFPNKTDKSVIEYNAYIKLSNIPLIAYEYVANGRSAIEWIMKQYKVKIDDDSGIKNDPNDWATEHDNPRYILDLLLSVITVSLETRKIVNSLPKLHF